MTGKYALMLYNGVPGL
eukprot:Gb_14898 [translate_table: standard]